MGKFQNFITKINKNKTQQYIFIAIISIIVILLIASVFGNGSAKQTDDYAKELEQRLEETLSKIDGAGKVKVMITLEETPPVAYTVKTEKTSNGSVTTKTPLTLNGEVVFLGDKPTTIAGVLIVAEGAKNLSVFSKLQYATTTLLNLEVSKIEILPSK